MRQQPLVRDPPPGKLRRSSPRLAPAARSPAAPREQAGRGASNAPVGDVVVRARVRVLADDGAHGRDLNLGPAAGRRALTRRVDAAEETVALTGRVLAESRGEGIAGDRLPRLHRRDGRLEDDALASRDCSRRHHFSVAGFARHCALIAARAKVQGGEVLGTSRRERIVEGVGAGRGWAVGAGPGRSRGSRVGSGNSRAGFFFFRFFRRGRILGRGCVRRGILDDGDGDPQLPAALTPLGPDALRARACVDGKGEGTRGQASIGASGFLSTSRRDVCWFPMDRFVPGRVARAGGGDEGAERVLIRRIDGTHRVEAQTAAPSRRRPPWTAPASAAMLRAYHPLAPRGITLRDPPPPPWLSPPTDWPRPRSRAAGPRLCLWCGDKRWGRSWPPLAVTCQQRIGRATQRVARRCANRDWTSSRFFCSLSHHPMADRGRLLGATLDQSDWLKNRGSWRFSRQEIFRRVASEIWATEWSLQNGAEFPFSSNDPTTKPSLSFITRTRPGTPRSWAASHLSPGAC